MYQLDANDASNNGFINEDLIVWMREAAFPNFKKLYGILVRSQDPFTNGMPAGIYSININYSIHSAARFTREASVVAWLRLSTYFRSISFPYSLE